MTGHGEGLSDVEKAQRTRLQDRLGDRVKNVDYSEAGVPHLDELGYEIKRPEDVAHPPIMDKNGLLIDSTDDARVGNNPPQQGAKGDPMRIQYRVLTDWEKERMGEMKLAFEALYIFLDELGYSRELSLAKTSLEESCMWATKHITR